MVEAGYPLANKFSQGTQIRVPVTVSPLHVNDGDLGLFLEQH